MERDESYRFGKVIALQFGAISLHSSPRERATVCVLGPALQQYGDQRLSGKPLECDERTTIVHYPLRHSGGAQIETSHKYVSANMPR